MGSVRVIFTSSPGGGCMRVAPNAGVLPRAPPDSLLTHTLEPPWGQAEATPETCLRSHLGWAAVPSLSSFSHSFPSPLGAHP